MPTFVSRWPDYVDGEAIFGIGVVVLNAQESAEMVLLLRIEHSVAYSTTVCAVTVAGRREFRSIENTFECGVQALRSAESELVDGRLSIRNTKEEILVVRV